MKKLMLIVAAGVLLTACGSKTQGEQAQTDSTAVVAEVAEKQSGEKKAVDQWTEEAVVARVNEIYNKVNEVFSQQEVDLRILDSLYCTKDYKDMYQQVKQAEEGKSFEELCFIEYQPWDLGLQTPIQVLKIRPKLLTGDMAEVFFDLKEAKGSGKCTAGWSLYLEDGVWKVHSFLSHANDHEGSWEFMHQYVERNKKK